MEQAQSSDESMLFASFVDAFINESADHAVRDLAAQVDDSSQILTRLFGVGYDGWIALFRDQINGRCLDLTYRFGRSAGMYSLFSRSVHVGERPGYRYRFAEHRIDNPRAKVIRIESPSAFFRQDLGKYDTIIARYSGSIDERFKTHLNGYASALADGGTIIIGIDSFSGSTGVQGSSFGGSSNGFRPLDGLRSSPKDFTKMIDDTPFASVQCSTVLPSLDRFEWAFHQNDPSATRFLLDSIEPDGLGPMMAKRCSKLAHTVGMLEYMLPTYVTAWSVDRREVTDNGATQVAKRGSNRTILFELEGSTPKAVRKIPIDPSTSGFNDRAVRTTRALLQNPSPISDMIPRLTYDDDGLSIITQPKSAGSLASQYSGRELARSPKSFERVLSLGISWIETFQRTYRDGRIDVPRRSVRSELDVSFDGLSPPEIDHAVSYPSVPVHGDYHPGNVHTDDSGCVQEVIDWEYSSPTGNPVSDPAFFTLSLLEDTFGNIQRGIEAGMIDDTAHARIVRSILRRYLGRMEISPSAFEALMGHSIARQIRCHQSCDTPWRYHTTTLKKLDDLQSIYEYCGEISPRLAATSPTTNWRR